MKRKSKYTHPVSSTNGRLPSKPGRDLIIDFDAAASESSSRVNTRNNIILITWQCVLRSRITDIPVVAGYIQPFLHLRNEVELLVGIFPPYEN